MPNQHKKEFGHIDFPLDIRETDTFLADGELMQIATHNHAKQLEAVGLSNAQMLMRAAFVDAKRRHIKAEHIRETMIEYLMAHGAQQYALLDDLHAVRKAQHPQRK